MRKVFVVLLVALFFIGTCAAVEIFEDVACKEPVDFSDDSVDSFPVSSLCGDGDGGGSGGGSPIPG